MSTSTLPRRPESEPEVDLDEPVDASDERPTLSLSATALAAGALAAVTSAVIGSHLGTAGTLSGAAIGSIIGATSTALYSFGLQRTWHALGGLNARRAKVLAGVLLTALAAFILSLGAITGVEKATGTSLAGQPGTTVSHAREAASERAATTGDTSSVVEESAGSGEQGIPTPTDAPTPAEAPSESTPPAPEPTEGSSTSAPVPASSDEVVAAPKSITASSAPAQPSQPSEGAAPVPTEAHAPTEGAGLVH